MAHLQKGKKNSLPPLTASELPSTLSVEFKSNSLQKEELVRDLRNHVSKRLPGMLLLMSVKDMLYIFSMGRDYYKPHPLF